MKSFDTDLKKYTEKIGLNMSERQELRERVLSYMEYHPLPKQKPLQTRVIHGIPADSFVMFHFSMLHARIAGGIFVVLLIIAPFAAERSVPGDVLYLVKTGFNESIQEKLATSPYEKIEFQTKLMERRIAEARVLASEGKLTGDVKQQLTDTVKGHTDAVQSGLAELRTKDADSAAIAEIAFNSSLEVQSAVLGVGGTEGDSGVASMQTILSVVNEAHKEVENNQNGKTPSFDGLMARVELETTRAYELFETVKVSATKEEITDIERRLSDANRLIGEAKDAHNKGKEQAADNLSMTLGLIQKLIVFMSNIDALESVPLETIVPVVLSDIERSDLAKEEIRVVNGIKVGVEQRLESIKSPVAAKVREGLVKTDALILQAQVALDVADVGFAENSIKEVKTLVTDLDIMTKQSMPETPIPDIQGTDEYQVISHDGATTTSASSSIEKESE
jgi:hypothetical protein